MHRQASVLATTLLELRHTLSIVLSTTTSDIMTATKTTIMSANELNDLDTHIEALPQELQDEIFQRYLEGVLKEPITTIIDRSYKSPPQLQINQDSRARASKMYYQHPRVFKLNFEKGLGFSLLFTWLESLSVTARETLDHVDMEGVKVEEQTAVIWGECRGHGVVETLRRGVLVLGLQHQGWQEPERKAWRMAFADSRAYEDAVANQ